jgi:hypothetical protein
MAHFEAFGGRVGAAALLGLLLALMGACSGSSAAHENEGGSAGTGGQPQAGTGGQPQAGSAGRGGSEQGGGHAGGVGGATQFDPSDLQLNDVSVLFPLPKTEQERSSGLLSVTAKAARGVLLPEALYDGVGHILGSVNPNPGSIGGDYKAPYANLRVVALRIDPCFAALEPARDGTDCENQLRLVVQETDAAGAFDSALHLFYSISRDEVLELVASIGGLRQNLVPGERLGKLQPHPVMVAEGLAGAMASGVRSAILAHAGEQNLRRITRMSAQGGPFWSFSGFDVASGKLASMLIPTLPSGDNVSQMFERSFGAIALAQPKATPASGSADDFMVLLDTQAARALSEAEQQAKLASLLRIENPGHHSPNTVDCVTCHVATPATKLVVEPTLGLAVAGLVDRFLPDAKLVPESELAATFDDQEPLTNVHAFSYTGMGVGINQRTVNESAAVVEYLSKQTFPGL